MRVEDIYLSTKDTISKLLAFLKFEANALFDEFLQQSCTKSNLDRILAGRHKKTSNLSWQHIQQIQRVCEATIKNLGYSFMNDSAKDFSGKVSDLSVISKKYEDIWPW